ncbi:LacI family DNA-binding transcriptional regulator [Paenibacillus spongiae]|uniref:LacI family DNA-binding transcriptional regulator n=1 Tax=Paenibacillus spongiae TaxID=2909671 RepID=A0ABY5SK07_9BACL|nr:LacI family DNA-binding transcriptional regulator [Paenibacillus spongiae]UVI32850.1 LacI family DNA-binding transcriptional regulator [Paenibacillus spongiae]
MKKITTSDISNYLGISRNTVSKALNNHPDISDETKQKIIDQAIKMGYKNIKLPPAVLPETDTSRTKSIAFITKRDVGIETFWMNVMSGVEELISGNRYEMKLSFIKNEDIDSLLIPQILTSGIDGFIVAGSVNKTYNEKLMSVSLPKVFIDIHSDFSFSELNSDIVMMESEGSIYQITRRLIQEGHRDIGFIGDLSIRSYMERWLGFIRAHYETGLMINPDYCITSNDPRNYQYYEDVAERLGALKQFPSAFVCANDVTAIIVIRYFRNAGMSIPSDIAVSGFDSIKEIEFLDFSLTTVINDEFRLGLRAAEQLLTRMREPNRLPEIIRLPTKVLFGESTTRPAPAKL